MRLVAAILLSAITLGASTVARADDEPRAVPVARIAIGPAWHVAPESEEETQIAVDATAGVAVALLGEDVGPVFIPELGYAFDGIGTHLFNVAAGVGFGHPLAFVAYHPRFMVGTAGSHTAVGMRNGLAFHVLGDMGSLEIGHQFVDYADVLHHDVRLMFGVNPAAFIFLLSQM